MDELDRNIALCTCLEVEEIRGKSQKNMKIKFQCLFLRRLCMGKCSLLVYLTW